MTVTPSVGPRIYYLALENGGIFANKDLRLAVAHAMTTDFLAQFGDLAKPWNQLMGSTTVQSDPEGTRTYPYDPDKARRRYLTSGGYDGTPVKIIYDVSDPYQVGQLHGAQAGPRGGGLHGGPPGPPVGASSSAARSTSPTARDISSTYWSADYPDAQDYISTNFVCGSFLNISHFCDEAIDAAFAATEAMPFGAGAGRGAARRPAAAHRRGRGHPGDGDHAAGRLGPARGRHPDAGHVRAVRLEARLGQGRRLSRRRRRRAAGAS